MANKSALHRVDMIVERRIILELKSTERFTNSAKRQLRSYVTGFGLDPGILITRMKPNFIRIIRVHSGDSGFLQYVAAVY